MAFARIRSGSPNVTFWVVEQVVPLSVTVTVYVPAGMLLNVDPVFPPPQSYVYGPVPLLAITVMLPLAPPLQVGSVSTVGVTIICGGSVTV